MTYYTTLNNIRMHNPCVGGWDRLLRHLGKTKADDEPLPLVTLLDSNGLADALWCLRACAFIDREARLFAVWCARQVQHLMTDLQSLNALDVSERYANGLANYDELDEAYSSAYAATINQLSAADEAARATVYSASYFAAETASVHAVCSSASASVLKTDTEETWEAARNAARKAQTEEFRRRFG